MGLIELITAVTFILGGNSYHVDREVNWNEENNIRGIEFQLKDSNYSPFIKFLDNSFNQPSKTIGINYQRCTNGELKLCGGYSAGVVDGYKDKEYPTFPYAAPYGSIKYKNFELGGGCLPTACMYELKLKVDF